METLKQPKTRVTAREKPIEELARFIKENRGWDFTPEQVWELAESATAASRLPDAPVFLQKHLFNKLARLRALVVGQPDIVEQAAIELGLLDDEPDPELQAIIRASLAEAEAKFLQKLEGK